MRRGIPLVSQSVFQSVGWASRCLAHHGDRPPYSEPGEFLSLAAPKHSIRIYRGVEFGVAVMRGIIKCAAR